MTPSVRIVRNRDLEASWGVLRAKEPGFMRSLITWMGGPAGYINTNPGVAIESRHCAVGLMDMGPGNRQPGVHTHTMNEIYIILEGEVESFDGVGNRHTAGPFDCLYIPRGVPHGVRTVGERSVKLLWVNDAIEKWGVSLYQEGPGPHPAENQIAMVSFRDLEPNWSAARAKEPGFLCWNVSWVGDEGTGPNYNPGQSIGNDKIGLGLSVLLPANRLADEAARADRLFVVVRGEGIVATPSGATVVGPQDAIYCPTGARLDLRVLDRSPLYVVRVHESAAAQSD